MKDTAPADAASGTSSVFAPAYSSRYPQLIPPTAHPFSPAEDAADSDQLCNVFGGNTNPRGASRPPASPLARQHSRGPLSSPSGASRQAILRSTASFRETAPKSSATKSLIWIEVSDPQVRVEGGPVAVPGFQRKYASYLVTASAPDPESHVQASSSVRRRFSDFVLLDTMLQKALRGHFIPPRPLKHVAHTQKLRQEFVEKRREYLQAYLRRLAAHPVIAESQALHVFLEAHEDMRSSPAWRSLVQPDPSWTFGMRRLLKQMVGRERLLPAPSEAARSTARSHDVVRKVREAVHHLRHKREKMGLPEKELELREFGEVLRALAGSISALAHATSSAHHQCAACVASVGEVGQIFMEMGALEQAAMHVDVAAADSRFGEGCISLAAMGQAAVHAANEHTQALQQQARGTAGMLFALHARDEALVTWQTLEIQAQRKRTLVESLQGQHNPKSVKALQDLAAAEAAEASSAAEYETVSLRNEADMQGYVAAQATELRSALFGWVLVLQKHALAEAEAWIHIAESLGCNQEHVAVIQKI